MKLVSILIMLLGSICSFALCGNDRIVFEIIISEGTSNRAFMNSKAKFTSSDFVRVFEIASKKTVYLPTGQFEDDGGGNYRASATSTDGETFKVSHDHEDWQNGLFGSYKMANGKIVDLSDVICPQADLIFVR